MRPKAFLFGSAIAILFSITAGTFLFSMKPILSSAPVKPPLPSDSSLVVATLTHEELEPLEDYERFPLAQPVLRQGAKVIEVPLAKYDQGMYVDVNLKGKVLTLFQDGQAQVLYNVLAIGPPDLPTPKGAFKVLHKEENHFASKEKVWMPWSLHIVGGIFIHGIPYYPDGRMLKSRYSHGCIRVNTDQQKELYQKVPLGTPVVVY